MTCEDLGLNLGQTLSDESRMLTHAGWYDRLGKSIGGGDISASDLRNISNRMPQGELVILARPMLMEEGRELTTLFTTTNFFIVAPGESFYWVTPQKQNYKSHLEIQGIPFEVLSRQEASLLLRTK